MAVTFKDTKGTFLDREEDTTQLARGAFNRELDTLEIMLTAKIGRTALTLEEYVQTRLSQGAALNAIKKSLLVDLEKGGRIFGEFRNAIKPTFRGSVSRFRDAGALVEMGVDTTYRWVAVLVNTCPDCLERHNNIAKWENWEAEGLPRTGATVCGVNCKCVLLPEAVTELDPIVRGR